VEEVTVPCDLEHVRALLPRIAGDWVRPLCQRHVSTKWIVIAREKDLMGGETMKG
jgi:hypothetical protein